jgi:transcriptional regulator with XRE-family HTH domain
MDLLDEVRRGMSAVNQKQKQAIADKAGLSMRTVYNLLNPERDPYYSTVKRLHDVLTAKPAPARKKK